MIWRWFMWFAVIGMVIGEEFGSTRELYESLMVSELYTFVYVYSHGCHSREVGPEFEQLAQLMLGEDGQPLVGLASIDGHKSRNFARQFNVESFPQLLLFKPQQEPAQTVLDLLGDVYHGGKSSVDMAKYLWQQTGHLPRWPKSKDSVIELDSLNTLQKYASTFNSYWSRSFTLNSSGELLQQVVLIAFVTPWTRTKYQDMFLGGMPNSLVDKLSAKYGSQLQLLRLDSSQENMASVVNEFRISTEPSIFLLFQEDSRDSRLALLELLPYDSQTWDHEAQLLSQLVDAAVGRNFSQLQQLSRDYHSIYLYDSLQQRQQKIQDDWDQSLADQIGNFTDADTIFSSIWGM